MKLLTQIQMKQHAVEEYPREACGVVINVAGKERYKRCRNMAEDAGDSFIINPEDYAAAEDEGEILALCHSHPDASPLPSEADKVMCSHGTVPWHIVSVNAQGDTSDISTHHPDGYVAPLVGRQFAHGVLDCYSLVRDYYSRELGITLPDFERTEHWWNKGDDLYMQHFRDAGFEPIKGAIKPHDVVLMQIRSPVTNHAGVYIGDGLMLHHMYGRLSTREVYGGYYLETTRLIVRHKEVAQ